MAETGPLAEGARLAVGARLGEPGLAARTIGGAVAWGRDALQSAGSESPRLDAELLLAFLLGAGRERLVLDADRPLSATELDRFGALIARRAAHEPVAYLLGRRDFRYLTLIVDPRVLIPRPETELLVEVGLALEPGARVVDVGTGSGAIALALKHERPDLVVSGVDVSADAVEVACGNASTLGLEVSFSVSDLLADVAGAFDAVLANLPYVASGAQLAPDVADYEPARALFAGAEGLDVIRRLISQLRGRAPLPSLIALEIGPEQAGEVSGLVAEAGFGSVEVRHDLAGLDRVIVGRA